MSAYGIDISEHNGNINLKPYVGMYVIIRAGWGLGHIDKKFTRNVEECEKLGIPYGVYWYSYALDAVTAKKEAKYFADAIKGLNVTKGAWLDLEDGDGWKAKQGWKPTKKVCSAIVNAFCKYMETEGWYTGVYLSYSWLQYLDTSTAVYDRWVAHYHTNDGTRKGDYSNIASIHQYTSKPIDKDYFYVTNFANPGKKGNELDEKVLKLLTSSDGDKTIRRANAIMVLAQEVLSGKYGTGEERKKKLGTDYDSVQAYVNYLVEKGN